MSNLDLTTLRKELQTQNNAMTQDPIFCVFEKETITGIEIGYSDEYVWFKTGEESTSTTECLKDYYGFKFESEIEKAGWEKVYYTKRHKFVNAHFTRKAAEHHIEINGHNLHEPFVYVMSAWRCPEMIAIRKALLEG